MMKFIREMANKNLIQFYRRACERFAGCFFVLFLLLSLSFCIWMPIEIPLYFFSIQFLFSFLRSRLKQTHTLASAVDAFGLSTFFPLDFAHIWCGSYHTDTIATHILSITATTVAAAATAESHSFSALLCIPILKMIVGLNHRVVLVVAVDLLTNATSYYHWIYSFW